MNKNIFNLVDSILLYTTNTMIGFASYNEYLVVIETNEYHDYNNNFIVDDGIKEKNTNDNSRYYTISYEIIETKNVITDEKNTDPKLYQQIKDEKFLFFWLNEELVLNMLNYKYKVRKNKGNYISTYKTYYINGNLQCEFYHMNGIKEGLFESYYNLTRKNNNIGPIKEKIHYQNGKKNGKYSIFKNNKEISYLMFIDDLPIYHVLSDKNKFYRELNEIRMNEYDYSDVMNDIFIDFDNANMNNIIADIDAHIIALYERI